MENQVNIFLVDDHPIVRSGLKSLIERLGNYKIVAEYDDGEDIVNDHPFKVKPDLIIMDVFMPVMDGTETVKKLKELHVDTPILMLTLETNESKIINLFRLGIRGYIAKSSSAQVIKAAINDVLTTGYYHNEMLIKALSNDNKAEIDEKSIIMAQITEREKEFLMHVCDEAEPTYEQIASKMGISKRTVDGYREALFEKFNIKSKVGLVLFAVKYGFVSYS